MLYHFMELSVDGKVFLAFQIRGFSANNRYHNHRMDGAYINQSLDKEDIFNNKHSYRGSYCKVEEIRDHYYNKRAKQDII